MEQWELSIFYLLFSLSKGQLIYILVVAIGFCCNTSQRNHALFPLLVKIKGRKNIRKNERKKGNREGKREEGREGGKGDGEKGG